MNPSNVVLLMHIRPIGATASAAFVLSIDVRVLNGKSVRLSPGTIRSYVRSCDILGAVAWRA